jgi:hypothetical protein
MDSAEKYEMIGTHIYRYQRVARQLGHLLWTINPEAEKELLHAEADLLIPRINAELNGREREIKRRFFHIAAEMAALKNDRDRNMMPGHIPDRRETAIFLDRCTDVLEKLDALKAILTQQQ